MIFLNTLIIGTLRRVSKKATEQGMTDEELLETLTSQVESQEEE